jgi:nitrous oxide reductase accessory protein NosL
MTRPLIAAAAAGALLLAGCGGSTDSAGSSSPTSASAGASGTAGSQDGNQLVVDLTIAGGKATPTNASLQAAVNQPIVFRVTSDAEDELHVHSTPEHEFEIKAGNGQSFPFTVQVPGRVDVELHKLGVTVATIQVR